MTPEQTDAVVEAISAALADTELTVDELDEQVVGRAGSWAGDVVLPVFDGLWPRWRLAVNLAAHRGALCFGPNRGRKVTYTSPRTSPRRWVPGFEPVDGRTALAEVARRYLRTHGPATSQQFAQWSGLARRGAAELFASLSDELCAVEVDGAPAWLPAGDDEPSTATGGLRLVLLVDGVVAVRAADRAAAPRAGRPGRTDRRGPRRHPESDRRPGDGGNAPVAGDPRSSQRFCPRWRGPGWPAPTASGSSVPPRRWPPCGGAS